MANNSLTAQASSSSVQVPPDQPDQTVGSRLADQKGLTVPANWRNPTLKQLNQEHPEYADVKDDWIKMSIMYEGGHAMRKSCPQFLRRRPRELQEVYQARVDGFTYHNILGTAFGWYRASLFKTPPTISMGVVDQKGQASGSIPEGQDGWYVQFRENCDRKNGKFLDLMREVWTSLALYRRAYVLLDVPRPMAIPPRNLREQKQAGIVSADGKANPYLVTYSPVSVINWETDQYGNLEWAVIAIQEHRAGFISEKQVVDTWYYFDRVKFVKWSRERKPNESSLSTIGQDQRADLDAVGYHALSKQQQVPLLRFEVPDGLWLANRAYLPTIDHLNADNSYAWALYMANLAMPVIISDTEIKPQLSEAGYIQLPIGSSYSWSEPEGKSFFHAGARVKELREEIYRAMYLMYQGRAATATADGASGVSKEMDMMPATDVMNEYGDVIVQAMQLTLNAVAQARGDVKVRADVRGMKFGKSATLEGIEKTEAVLALGIPSDEFEKQALIQAASEYLPDANSETMELIVKEIRQAPNQAVRAALVAQQRQQDFSDQLTSSVASFNTPPLPATPKKPKQNRAAALTSQGT